MAKGCNGKRRRSLMQAIAAAIRLSRRGTPLRVYRCPDCEMFHLTKQALRGPAGEVGDGG